MKSAPTLRLLMAAGMYLLLMWGYVVLPMPQLYAVFAALIMCIALLFWVSEARAAEQLSLALEERLINDHAKCDGVELDDPTLHASMMRLDTLKMELSQQYAQFGRDQALLNSKGLGTWHGRRGQEGKEG